MIKSILPRTGAVTLLALLTTGCVSTESCDPNRVGNVLTSAACSSGGYYEARNRNMQSNVGRISGAVQEERIAISNANRRIRSAEAEQRISASQARALNSQVSALNADVDRLARSPGQEAVLRAQIERRKQAINDYSELTVF